MRIELLIHHKVPWCRETPPSSHTGAHIEASCGPEARLSPPPPPLLFAATSSAQSLLTPGCWCCCGDPGDASTTLPLTRLCR